MIILNMFFDMMAADIHQVAREHGWWDRPRPVPELLCLIHSEIDEAAQAYDHGDFENFQEEIADVMIRLLDMAAGMGIHLLPKPASRDFGLLDVPQMLLELHAAVSAALEAYRAGDMFMSAPLSVLAADAAAVSVAVGFDLPDAITKKHEHNKGRRYRHGGKRC